jgi:hypothetical protein
MSWRTGMMGSDAVRNGKGALFDDQRVELVEGAPSRWSLVFGRLTDGPSRVDLPGLDGCQWPNLAYVAGSLMFSCGSLRDEQKARLFRSSPGGDAFSELPSLRADPHVHYEIFPLLQAGGLLIVGACRAQDRCPDSDPTGRERSQLLIRDASGKIERAALADSDPHNVYAVRVTPGGDIYALATDYGINYLAVSRDHGRTFVRREYPTISEGNEAYEPHTQPWRAYRTLHAEDGGTVVIISLAEAGGWVRYVSKDFGQHFEARRVPLEVDALDLAGRRGFAYADSSTEAAWETNDAGATWRPAKPPPQRAGGSMHWSSWVACGEAGCLIDTNVVRLGWDLPSTAGEPLR